MRLRPGATRQVEWTHCFDVRARREALDEGHAALAKVLAELRTGELP
jgi:hypothetical protein